MSVRNGMRRVSSGTIKARKSMAMASLGDELGGGNDGDAGSGMHSLAHELAVALMPEPSAGSKMLQEEFGIEFDEGAEGIDEPPVLANEHGESLADETNGYDDGSGDGARTPTLVNEPIANGSAAHRRSTSVSSKSEPQPQQQRPQDPMNVLARELESTDKFLAQLRHIDADSSQPSSQVSIEKFASDVIRHINDSVRDREGQVRELLEYEREFRKIAAEVNGNDVLGRLEPLPVVEGLIEGTGPVDPSRPSGGNLDTIQEEVRSHRRAFSNDWETNPDDNFLGDEEEDMFNEEAILSPTKDSFVVPPPPVTGPPTIAKLLPELVHVRTLTTTLVTSLTAISEHAQVNGAANADAGRKIRALKNKLGGWRSEWDSAEQSRLKIERWEAGLTDDDKVSPGSIPLQSSGRRFNARRIVDEHLRAFQLALADAGTKTQAIMKT